MGGRVIRDCLKLARSMQKIERVMGRAVPNYIVMHVVPRANVMCVASCECAICESDNSATSHFLSPPQAPFPSPHPSLLHPPGSLWSAQLRHLAIDQNHVEIHKRCLPQALPCGRPEVPCIESKYSRPSRAKETWWLSWVSTSPITFLGAAGRENIEIKIVLIMK